MADQKDQTQNFPTITRAAYFQHLPDHSPGYLEETPEAAIQLAQSLFEGYSKMDPSEILVKKLTGGGGNFACWKVSPKADISQDNWFTANPDLIPSIPAVVIHSRIKTDDLEHWMEKKMSLMQKLFWENDITVPRLCQGNHWWVEPAIVDDWSKEGITVTAIAKIIANVHKLPTDWYKEIRDHIKGMYPCLRDASDGSNVWIKASKSSDWERDGWLNEESQKFAISCDKEPISTAGKRIVNCHMDFHRFNLVSNKELEKNYLVDFEYSCVSTAAIDLAFTVSCIEWNVEWCQGNPDWWKDFMRTYLETLGLPATDQEIQNLMIDAQCGWLLMLHGHTCQEIHRKIFLPEYEWDLMKFYQKFVSDV